MCLQAILSKLPGVTSKNIRGIMESVRDLKVRAQGKRMRERERGKEMYVCLLGLLGLNAWPVQELSDLSEKRLKKLMGKKSGKVLYDFFHTK